MHTPDCDITTKLVKTMEPVKRRVPGFIEPREPQVGTVRQRQLRKPEFKNQTLVDAENDAVFAMDRAINEGQRLASIDRELTPTAVTASGRELYYVAGSDVQNYLDQMSGDGLMMKLMQDNEANLDAARMQRRQTWDQAVEMARTLGIDESILMNKTFNPRDIAPRVFALYNAQEGLVTAMQEVATKIASGQGTDVDRVNLFRLADRFNEANEAIFGVRATLGRGLNAIKMINSKKDLAEQRRAVQQAIKQFRADGTNMLADELATLIANSNSAAQVGRAAQGLLAKNVDKLVEYWINSNLSAVTTQVANVVSNAATTALLIPETAIAALVGRGPERVYFGEVAETLKGLVYGASTAMELAKTAFRMEQSVLNNTPTDSYTGGAIGGRLGKFIRIPSRLLLAGDQFFQVINRDASMRSLLYRRAKQQGMTSADARQFVDDHMNGALPIPEDIREQALAKAQYQTFTNDLDRKGALEDLANFAIQFRRKHPTAAFIIPFIRTPVNIVRYMQDRSLAALLDPDIRAALREGGPKRDEAVSRMVLGTGVSLMALSLAAEGIVTGSGPSDPDERKAWEAAGNRAYTIKIGDTLVQYNRYAPWGLTIGIAADMHELIQEASKEENTFKMLQGAFFKLMQSVAKNVFDQTMITGISNLNKAIIDPERYGDQVFYSLMAPLVPGIGNNIARTFDPTIKEVDNVVEALAQRIPGVRPSVGVQRKPLGEERRLTEGEDTAANMIGRFLLPGFQGQVEKDPVYGELQAINYIPGKPNKAIRIRGKDYELEDDQVNRLVELAGPRIKSRLTALMARPAYARLSEDRKQEIIERIVRRERKIARLKLIRELVRTGKLSELKEKAS